MLADPHDLLGVASVQKVIHLLGHVVVLALQLKFCDKGYNLYAVDQRGKHLRKGSYWQHMSFLGESRHQSLGPVDLALRRLYVPSEDCIVIFSIYFGHDELDIPLKQF